MALFPFKKLVTTWRQIQGLAAAEIALLRAEVNATKQDILVLALFGSAAIILWLAVLGLLAATAIFWLIHYGIPAHIAVTAAAVVMLLLALIISFLALRKLKSISILPRRTMQQVAKDINLLKGRPDE